MIFFISRKFFNMPGNFKMSEVKICPSHDLPRLFILQAITMIGAHRNIVVLLKISVFVYIFFVPAGHLSGTISCAASSPKSWVDLSWDRPSQNRAWAPPNFGTFSCARPQNIFQAISGYKIEFFAHPEQKFRPREFNLNSEETEAMGKIIIDLEERGIIKKCAPEVGDFLNTVFLREKRTSVPDDRKFNMILNVKELNKYVLSSHFKMETLDTCLQMMQNNWYMASFDLKDAYFTILMHEHSQSTLSFKFTKPLTLSSLHRKVSKIHQGFSPRL